MINRWNNSAPRYFRESSHFAILPGSCQIGAGNRAVGKYLIKITKMEFMLVYGQYSRK
jgi:hypothetical protein